MEYAVQMELPIFFIAEKELADNLQPSGRLLLAIFAQAVRDAASKVAGEREEKQSAKAWLLEYGANYLEAVTGGDAEYYQNKIEKWVEAGCIIPKKGRWV